MGNLNSHENILINRGSGHVHGVIWSDIDKYLETATTLEKKHLKDAMKMLMEDKAPSSEQSEAMATYVDNFVSVSLRDPATRDIVKSVNVHNHTHTCRKKGSKCRFCFPRLPSRRTITATPLRLVFLDEKEKIEKQKQIKAVLTKVRNCLIDAELMATIDLIGKEVLDEAYELDSMKLKLTKLIEDPVFSKQIKRKDGIRAWENMFDLRDHLSKEIEKLNVGDALDRRLGALLMSADIYEELGVDEDDPLVEEKLLEEYHELLSWSTKGFKVVLKRDVMEGFVNNFNPEWIEIWSSNMDIAPVMDFYSVLVYVADYAFKRDDGMMKALLQALKDEKNNPVMARMRTLKKVFLTHRQMGMAEIYYRLFPSFHLTDSNIGCTFVHTGLEKHTFLMAVSDEEAVKANQGRVVKIDGREGIIQNI